MNNASSFLQFRGCLNLELDQVNEINVKMEFKGQSVKITFSSIKALRMFVLFKKNIENNLHTFLIQDCAHPIKLSYYIKDYFIGESNRDLRPSRLGSYFGLERSKFHFGQILAYLFNLKSSSRKNCD
ncbi:MAG: hypothetical protein H0X29_08850 [Parachlamydiaceae bacterium]|nr:hypothetical protein [Parachlamydiaceae bacterium]